MSNLLENTRSLVKKRKSWLSEAERALSELEKMPAEIQGLPSSWSADFNNDELSISINYVPELEVILNSIGKLDFIPTFSEYSGEYKLRGSILLSNGTTIRITVYNADIPHNCRIEKVEELKKVITYKSICEEEL